MKKMTITSGQMRIDDVAKLRHRCAWDGCTATTPVSQNLPRDWRWLIMGWWPSGGFGIDKAERDCVLCGPHARQLDAQLIDIGNRMREPKGSA